MASLYDRVAAMLVDLHVGVVLDVGCADGVLRAALSLSGPHLVGVDASAILLRDHPAPVVRADTASLPFADDVFDAVTALNVFYHVPDPLSALREAHRVLHASGHLVVSAIARDDSSELTTTGPARQQALTLRKHPAFSHKSSTRSLAIRGTRPW